jgi:hypothetical protein
MVEEAYIRIREPEHPEVIVTAAFCIERDFRGLVERLGRTFEMVDSSDEELRERIANTKAAAERGLRLSKLLLRATRRRRA